MVKEVQDSDGTIGTDRDGLKSVEKSDLRGNRNDVNDDFALSRHDRCDCVVVGVLQEKTSESKVGIERGRVKCVECVSVLHVSGCGALLVSTPL